MKDPAEKNVCNRQCVAGHTVNLAGRAGYDLCKRVGFAAAAALIHAVSRPDVAAPRYDLYPSEWALAYIQSAGSRRA